MVRTHPFDVFAEGLAEAGAENLELDVSVGAVVLEVHQPRQTCDVALRTEVTVKAPTFTFPHGSWGLFPQHQNRGRCELAGRC